MPSTTTFRSDATFTPRTFRRWVNSRPMSDINRYELVGGRIVMTPPAGWLHGSIEAHVVAALQQHVASPSARSCFRLQRRVQPSVR